MTNPDIPGYTHGTKALPKSTVTLEDLAKLEHALGLTEEDRLRIERKLGAAAVFPGRSAFTVRGRG